MLYFVIAPDGSKYGPADLNTLRTWMTQGRISPQTILEVQSTGQRVQASVVLSFGGEVPSFAPPASGYGRPEFSKSNDKSGTDLFLSYICSALSIICCGFFIIGGFVYANRALAKGNRGGMAARYVAIIFLIIWIVTTILEIMFFDKLKEMFMPKMGLDAEGLIFLRLHF